MNNNKDLEKLKEWESQQNEKNKEYINFEEFNGKYKKNSIILIELLLLDLSQ